MSDRTGIWKSCLVLLAYAVLVGVCFWPVVTGEKTLLSHDNLVGYYPLFVAKPLWHEALQGGFPLFADLQSQTFYPPALLFPGTPAGFHMYALSSVVLACFFAYLLAFDLTRHRGGSFAAGLVFGLCGSVAGQITMLNVTVTSSWMPLVLLYCLRIMRDGPRAGSFAGAAFSTLFALWSGHSQFFVHILLFAGIGGLCYAVQDGRVQWERLLASGGAVVTGILLTAFALLPFLELLPLTQRGGKIGLDGLASYQMPVSHLVRLIFPHYFGSPGENSLLPAAYPYPMSGFHNYHELNRYAGLLPLLLLPSGWAAVKDRRLKWFLGGSFVFFFLFALGTQTPLLKALNSVPVINRLRGPARHFLEISLIASILTAFAFRALTRENMLKLALWCATLLVCMTAVALWGPVVPGRSALVWSSFAGNNLILFQFFIAAVLVGGCLTAAFTGHRAATGLLVLAAFADLSAAQRYADWYFNSNPGVALERSPDFPYAKLDREYMTYVRYPTSLDSMHYYRTSASVPNQLAPNLAILGGHREFFYYNPLSLDAWNKVTMLSHLKPDVLSAFGVRYEITALRTEYIPAEGVLAGACIDQGVGGIGAAQTVRMKLPEAARGRLKLVTSVVCGKGDPRILFRIMGEGRTTDAILAAGRDTGLFSSCAPSDAERAYEIRNGFTCLNLYSASVEAGHAAEIIEFTVPTQHMVHLHGIGFESGSGTQYYSPASLVQIARRDPFVRAHRFAAFENTGAMPEVYVVSDTIRVTPELALAKMASADWDPSRTALVENGPVLSGVVPGWKAKIVSSSPREVVIEVESDRAAFLVLNHTYYPGWTAAIDGQRTPTYRTNVAVRGVAIPAGKHSVVFSFVPASLYTGIAISLVTLLGLGFVLVRAAGGRR